MNEEKITHIARFEESPLSEREKMAMRYTEMFNLNPGSSDDAFFDQLKAVFTEGEIVELTFIIMTYSGLHRFNSVIDLEPRDPDRLTTVSVTPAAAHSG